jgi:nucleoside-diphosphate-sugar epimerase
VSRAKEYFGFTAEVALEDGLKRTIAWYEENQVGD